MNNFFNFFFTTSDGSGKELITALIVCLAGVLAALVFTFFEYRAKKFVWLFIAANAVSVAAVTAVLLFIGASLSELLLALMLMLLVRVTFVFAKERDRR